MKGLIFLLLVVESAISSIFMHRLMKKGTNFGTLVKMLQQYDPDNYFESALNHVYYNLHRIKFDIQESKAPLNIRDIFPLVFQYFLVEESTLRKKIEDELVLIFKEDLRVKIRDFMNFEGLQGDILEIAPIFYESKKPKDLAWDWNKYVITFSNFRRIGWIFSQNANGVADKQSKQFLDEMIGKLTPIIDGQIQKVKDDNKTAVNEGYLEVIGIFEFLKDKLQSIARDLTNDLESDWADFQEFLQLGASIRKDCFKGRFEYIKDYVIQHSNEQTDFLELFFEHILGIYLTVNLPNLNSGIQKICLNNRGYIRDFFFEESDKRIKNLKGDIPANRLKDSREQIIHWYVVSMQKFLSSGPIDDNLDFFYGKLFGSLDQIRSQLKVKVVTKNSLSSLRYFFGDDQNIKRPAILDAMKTPIFKSTVLLLAFVNSEASLTDFQSLKRDLDFNAVVEAYPHIYQVKPEVLKFMPEVIEYLAETKIIQERSEMVSAYYWVMSAYLLRPAFKPVDHKLTTKDVIDFYEQSKKIKIDEKAKLNLGILKIGLFLEDPESSDCISLSDLSEDQLTQTMILILSDEYRLMRDCFPEGDKEIPVDVMIDNPKEPTKLDIKFKSLYQKMTGKKFYVSIFFKTQNDFDVSVKPFFRNIDKDEFSEEKALWTRSDGFCKKPGRDMTECVIRPKKVTLI